MTSYAGWTEWAWLDQERWVYSHLSWLDLDPELDRWNLVYRYWGLFRILERKEENESHGALNQGNPLKRVVRKTSYIAFNISRVLQSSPVHTLLVQVHLLTSLSSRTQSPWPLTQAGSQTTETKRTWRIERFSFLSFFVVVLWFRINLLVPLFQIQEKSWSCVKIAVIHRSIKTVLSIKRA